MCKSCCENLVKLKSKPEECTPEQIWECHGDAKRHPCPGQQNWLSTMPMNLAVHLFLNEPPGGP
jgi:hypothetical protein